MFVGSSLSGYSTTMHLEMLQRIFSAANAAIRSSMTQHRWENRIQSYILLGAWIASTVQYTADNASSKLTEKRLSTELR